MSGNEYVVTCLFRRELCFSSPEDFAVTEIDLDEEIGEASAEFNHGVILDLVRRIQRAAKAKRCASGAVARGFGISSWHDRSWAQARG